MSAWRSSARVVRGSVAYTSYEGPTPRNEGWSHPVVAARGVDLRAHTSSTLLFRLPPWLGARLFRVALALLPPARVVVESHTNPDELRFTCRDVLVDARQRGLSTPRLEAASAYFRDPG